MNSEQIFIAKLNELAAIASDPAIERMMDACRILRMFFLDGDKSVVDQANRAVRTKLEFEVTSIESTEDDSAGSR